MPHNLGALYYMKKLKISDILGIGVIGLILCLGLSIIAKNAFDISSDFLTSATTLFAALVALYVYSDWREPHNLTKFQSEQSEIRISIRIFRNNYYEFNSHVLEFKNGESTNEADTAKFLQLERQMLNSLDDLSDNLHFYSHNFIKEINDKDYKNHKDNLILYSKEIQNFYIPFMQNDPYTDFSNYFTVIDEKVRTSYFMNIVEKISKDLPRELAILSKKMMNLENENGQ